MCECGQTVGYVGGHLGREWLAGTFSSKEGKDIHGRGVFFKGIVHREIKNTFFL